MKTAPTCKALLIGLLVMAIPQGAFGLAPGAGAPFGHEELDQMLAPVALYPDSLLAQILMASTYPLEVVSAERWVRKNRNLKGDQLNDAVDRQDWDPSVKALVPFPEVLAMMSEQIDWTQKLGDAFLAQEEEVMDTIQRLRAKARAHGSLKTGTEQEVFEREGTIVIEPANPTLIYVPVYDPALVYGPWWYPAYPPYYCYYPGVFFPAWPVLAFGVGIIVGPGWNCCWGHWNWHHRHINVNINRRININRRNINPRNINTSRWTHNGAHRRNVPYRDAATRERYGHRRTSTEIGRDFRGYPKDQGDVGVRTRPAPDFKRQGTQPRRSPRAFQDMGSGTVSRMNADRGRTSREISSGRVRPQGAGRMPHSGYGGAVRSSGQFRHEGAGTGGGFSGGGSAGSRRR